MSTINKKFTTYNKILLLVLIAILLFLFLFLSYNFLNRNQASNTGLTGANGKTGVQGETGSSGNNGSIGITGQTGTAGQSGTAGATGTNGKTGAQGETGSSGNNGSIGITGQTGTTGQSGSTGATGSSGTIGTSGSTGAVSLLKITNEGSGINCPTGGKKIESGIDTNVNGILDISEITATNYICNGLVGITGANGENGTNGLPGVDGSTGPAGQPGTNAPIAYGYIYNVAVRSVALEAPIVFDSNGPLLGITHTVSTSGITISNAGVYSINFIISGSEPNQFTVFVNGVPSASTIYGSGAGIQQNGGQTILSLLSGDIITIVNHTSAGAVTLAGVIGGTETSINASVLIKRLN